MTPEDELVGGDIIHPVLHLVGGRPVVGIELIDTLGNESGVEEIPEHEGPEASQHDDYCAHETPPTLLLCEFESSRWRKRRVSHPPELHASISGRGPYFPACQAVVKRYVCRPAGRNATHFPVEQCLFGSAAPTSDTIPTLILAQPTRRLTDRAPPGTRRANRWSPRRRRRGRPSAPCWVCWPKTRHG